MIDRPDLLLNITGIASKDILSNLLDVSNEFMKDVRGGFFGIEVQLQLGDLKERVRLFNLEVMLIYLLMFSGDL